MEQAVVNPLTIADSGINEYPLENLPRFLLPAVQDPSVLAVQ
jgi:hypothetical protein